MGFSEKGYKVALVGATGLVGTAIIRTLERLPLPIKALIPAASERSAGTKINFSGTEIEVQKFHAEIFDGCDFVFFSGKDGLSEEFCPVAADVGAWVIDNSAVFRMVENVPLVVPEVNLNAVGETPGIIANPNCSTIQLAVALAPIRDAVGLNRVIVSTYQAASGAGGEYLEKMERDTHLTLHGEKIEQDSLAFNVLPAVGSEASDGKYTEETKLENELRKILEMPDLLVSATAVRVPVKNCHSESVVIETESPITPDKAREIWVNSKGLNVLDNFDSREFPTPRICDNTDPVWVGRTRNAEVFENGLAFWVVADNLLKGAALNAVQIAVEIHNRGK